MTLASPIFAQILRNPFVKLVVAGLDAARVLDRVDADLLVRALGHGFQRRLGFFNQGFSRLVAHRHLEVHFHLGGGGRGHGAGRAAGACGSSGGGVRRGVFVDSCGMVMVSPQAGHSISVPAPAPSTASSWLQLGQSKTMSISRIGLNGLLCAHIKPAPRFKPEKNADSTATAASARR